MSSRGRNMRRQHAIRLFILTYGTLTLVALLALLYIAAGGGT